MTNQIEEINEVTERVKRCLTGADLPEGQYALLITDAFHKLIAASELLQQVVVLPHNEPFREGDILALWDVEDDYPTGFTYTNGANPHYINDFSNRKIISRGNMPVIYQQGTK